MSATLSSTIRIYSLHNGKVLKTLQASEYVSEKYPCPALVFAGQAAPQVNGHAEKDPNSMDVDDGALSAAPAPARKTPRPAWVVAGSENGKTIIWDLQERRVLQVLEGHTSPVVALAVHPSGKSIATGSLEPEKSIKLWHT